MLSYPLIHHSNNRLKEAKPTPNVFYWINMVELSSVTIEKGNYTVGKPDRNFGKPMHWKPLEVYEEQKVR